MKTLKTACAIITGLLMTSASVLAQVAPPTPAEAAGPSYNTGGDLSLVTPKPKANFYLQGGLIYTHAKIGDQYHSKDNVDMFGINAAFGWRIDQYNKIEIEAGILGSSENNHGVTMGYANKVTYAAVPVLTSYSLCIPLAKDRKCELRLTPTIGYYSVAAEYDHYVIGPRWIDGDDSGGAFAYGVGVGITCHLNQRFYLDIGYRYLGVGSIDLKYTELKSQTTHSAIASFGWKF